MKTRPFAHIIPIRGDAVRLPFTDGSIDTFVSSQLLEHIPNSDKAAFFHECARALKVNGILAVSTPNADYIERNSFWLSRCTRTLIPQKWLRRLPGSLRGPWLEESVEQWETRVGHYDHGCRLKHIQALSASAGLEVIDVRFMHTRLTSFWMQLMFTFPLLFLLALPLVRLCYFLESKMKTTDGINLMITFRKLPAGAVVQDPAETHTAHAAATTPRSAGALLEAPQVPEKSH